MARVSMGSTKAPRVANSMPRSTNQNRYRLARAPRPGIKPGAANTREYTKMPAMTDMGGAGFGSTMGDEG